VASGRGALIEAENRSQLMVLLQEGLDAGAPIKAVANLFGICSRTLKRWNIAINTYVFSVDSHRGFPTQCITYIYTRRAEKGH
jgi:hypothetical protein